MENEKIRNKYFFGGFPVAGMRKKNDDVKGGRLSRWGVCHDTIGCIMTGGGLASRLFCETGHDTAVQALRHDRAGATRRAIGSLLQYKLVS